MKTSEILNKAADLIEQRGWGKGPGTWSGDRLCLEGGLMAAMGVSANHTPDFHFCPAHRAVSDYLGRDLHEDAERHLGVWSWNDEPARTANEVIEVLRAAAVIEAAKETEAARVSVA